MFEDEGYRLMGAAFEVYNVLGYLLNFGRKGDLEWKRIIISEFYETQKNER